MTLTTKTYCQTSSSQFQCGFDEYKQSLIDQSPELLQEIEHNERVILEYIYKSRISRSGEENYIFPVVFHLIKDPVDASGELADISSFQIQNQLDILNDYFKNNPPPGEEKGLNSTASNIKFCLATKRPDGTPFPDGNGIVRYSNSYTNNVNKNNLELLISASDYYPQDKYINIYIVKDITTSDPNIIINGFATLPTTGLKHLIVMRYNRMGDSRTCSPCNCYGCDGSPVDNPSNGKVLVHEMGHFLNLLHTFEGGCSGLTLNDCETAGDKICDTPPTENRNFGCQKNLNTCNDNLIDQTENYMDYSDESCVNTFTNGQVEKMHATIQSIPWLRNLSTITNWNDVGISCVPVNLYPNIIITGITTQLCTGRYIDFTGIPNLFSTPSGSNAATTYSWYFQGGSDESGNPFEYYVRDINEMVRVYYYQPGSFDVSLTVTNGTTLEEASEYKSDFVFIDNCAPITGNQNQWYFGKYCHLNFSSGYPVADLDLWNKAQISPENAFNTLEGTAVFSDNFGNVIFYTDGINVWNRNNEKINDRELSIGVYQGTTSVSQAAIALIHPTNPNLIYLFITDMAQYNIIDISSGMPNITSYGQSVGAPLDHLTVSEQIVVVPKCDYSGYWIIQHGRESSLYEKSFFVYELSASGVTNIIEYPFSNIVGLGQLKASPDGTKLAIATSVYDNAFLFDFNAETGVISNPKEIYIKGGWGVSFSPNSKLLYITVKSYLGKTGIFQIDIYSNDINKAISFIEYDNEIMGLQMGPDNKIYGSQPANQNLAVINYPDLLVTNDNPNNFGLNVNGPSVLTSPSDKDLDIRTMVSLPGFVEALPASPETFDFNFKISSCSEVDFSTSPCFSSYTWNFGDGNFSSTANPTHIYPNTNFKAPYQVSLSVIDKEGNNYIINKTIFIGMEPVTISNTNCVPDISVSQYYSIVNFNPKYNYIWSVTGGDYSISQENNNVGVLVTWTNPSNGFIEVTAVDYVSGCTSYNSKIISFFPSVTLSLSSTNSCPDMSNGSVSLVVTGGSAPFSTIWSNGFTGNNLSNLSSGNYSVTVTDINNCTTFAISTVNEYPEIILDALITDAASCNENNGSIDITVIGGTPPLTYLWSNGSTTKDIQNLSAGTYGVNVTDVNGCFIDEGFKIEIDEHDYPNGYTVTTDEIWDCRTINLWGVLHITNNAVLTINNSNMHIGFKYTQLPDEFNPRPAGDSKILIEPGSKLIIDNTTLEGIYDPVFWGYKWGGIIIKGDPNKPDDETNQGVVEIKNNSEIKNAIRGILAQGGIIKADNSRFVNNGFAIVIDYNKHQNNNSSISKCYFEKDDNNLFNLDIYNANPFIQVSGNKSNSNITLKDNTFIYSGSSNFKGTGIDCYNGGFTLSKETSSEGNIFTNLIVGVHIAGEKNGLVVIEDNTFNNVAKGIRASSDHLSVKRNYFLNIPAASNIPTTGFEPGDTYGVRLLSARGFEIHENTFSGSFSSNPFTTASYGIAVENSGQEGGTIYDNTFSGTDYGVQTQDDNQNLNLRCNRFGYTGSHGEKSWFTVDGSLRDQGKSNCDNFPGEAAGNKWYVDLCDPLIIPPQNETDIKSNVEFEYFANLYDKEGEKKTIPYCKSDKVILYQTCANETPQSCSSSAPGIVKPPDGSGIVEIENWLNSIKQLIVSHCEQINSLKTTILELSRSIDGGNTRALLEFINKIPPAPVTDLYKRLQASLPLSDNALLNVINRKEKLPPGLLTDLLKKNSPLEKEVWKTIIAMKPALPLKNMRELEQAQNQTPLYPKLKVFEKEWHLNRGDIRHLENEIVSVLLRNKMSEKLEEIILENRCEKNDKWVAELQIDKKQFNEARVTLNKIQQESINDTLLLSSTLVRVNLKENLNYCKLMNCLVNIYESGRDIDSLTEHEIAIMKEVAYAKTPTSVKAELILEGLRIESFEHPIKKDHSISARKGNKEEQSAIEQLNNENLKTTKTIIIYPNPAQNIISLNLNLSEDKNYEIQLYNTLGQSCYKSQIKRNSNINLSSIQQNGVYIFKIFENNSLIKTGKIIIYK